MMGKSEIWLIGAGPMAIDYAKVLDALDLEYIVVGRGEDSANNFESACSAKVVRGGLEAFLKSSPELPKQAIVTVGIDVLSETTITLLKYGVKEILLEKPGVGYINEIGPLVNAAKEQGANVLLAYNRRFYASVLKAREIIAEDGGVSSFNFEFTEWSHVVGTLNKTKAEHHNWFIGNSSHIIDTSFYLGGNPKELAAFKGGSKELDWHPTSSIYSGAGQSESGALFSYQANWIGPGRWVIEMLTRKHRLIFKPIEQLQIQEIGSVAVNPVEGVDYSLDEQFKPGLYLQTKTFLDGDYSDFCNIYQQERMLELYTQMSGYPTK